MMKKNLILCTIAAGALLFAPLCAGAETITSEDGVLSIETPDDTWAQTTDPNYWFVISDGKSIITIDHLSNGENLPVVTVANENYTAVAQSFVSTLNEVFVVKGMAAEQKDLEGLLRMMGTIKILKFDTKQAISSAPASSGSAFGLREINEDYYITANDLRVRTDYSVDAAVIGSLYKGEQVRVLGEVTKDGADYGWCKIMYQGSTAYISDQYLSKTAPASTADSSKSTEAGYEQCQYCGKWFQIGDEYREHLLSHSMENIPASSENDLVQCEYCGEWFHAGNDYRNHVMAAHSGATQGDGENEMVQCEYCGEWFSAGNDYRNHVMAAHSGDSSDNSGNSGNGENEMVQCEICGQFFSAGDDIRNHMLSAHPEVSQGDGEGEMVQCEYCGEWFSAGNDYRNHVMAAHSGN